MNSITSVSASTASETPFTVVLDSNQHHGFWRYWLTNPDGTVRREAGQLPGADEVALQLFAAAHVLPKIPSGCSVQIFSTAHGVTSLGQQLTVDAPVEILPFLPFTNDRRAAWQAVLPMLKPLATQWRSLSRNDHQVIDLERWAATQGQ